MRLVESLNDILTRALTECEAARGKTPFVSVILLAHHRQVDTVRSILDSLTLRGLPSDARLDVQAMVMADEQCGYGTAFGAVLAAAAARLNGDPRSAFHVDPSTPPYRGIHYLFAYGQTVNRAVAATSGRLARAAGDRVAYNHIVVRVSGDVRIEDPEILAKLVRPLSDPAMTGVCISCAVQESDWDRDELVRRILVKPRMLECLRGAGDYVVCTSSAPQGSLSAYMAPMLTGIGISEPWGGGEDGVGFSLLHPGIRGVIVRHARVWHCHAGRPLHLQFQVLGEWFCTGIVNKLNSLSARLGGVDQTRAYRYFMTHGILSPSAAGAVRRWGPLFGHTAVIHVLRGWYAAATAARMLGPIARRLCRKSGTC